MLYLALNFFSVIVPFVFSFHPKIRFNEKFRYFFPGLIITTIVFVVWDAIFTKLEVWGFNEKYIFGPHILYLPIEEWLFFICIPFACVFTYFTIRKLKPRFAFSDKWVKRITSVLLLLVLIVLIINFQKLYTFYTGLFFVLTLSLVFLYKRHILNSFYPIFLVLLIPFFIVNGILTGSGIEGEVVWYNNAENLGIRMGTIPIEDSFYAFVMIIATVFFTEIFSKKSV